MVTATRGAGLAPECRARVQLPAAHEVTPADTVEVTACGENRLPAAGNNKGALTLRLHPAHDRAAHKAKEEGVGE